MDDITVNNYFFSRMINKIELKQMYYLLNLKKKKNIKSIIYNNLSIKSSYVLKISQYCIIDFARIGIDISSSIGTTM